MSSLAVSRSSLRCYSLGRPPASRHSLWEEPYGEIGPLPTKRVGLLLFFYMVFFSLLFEGFGLFSLGCFPSFFLFAPKWGLSLGKEKKKVSAY